jgi:hypothetical protein
VRAQGEAIGHVTTGEYGSQMLSLGGVHHLTGGSKKEGRVTCDGAARQLCNKQGGRADHRRRRDRDRGRGRQAADRQWHRPNSRMRVGCGSATIGMFAKQWHGKVDEVVVVDDHITGVLSEHQAGKVLGMAGDRHQDEGPALDARPLFPGGGARHRLGRHQYLRPADHPRPFECQERRAARPVAADGFDHRRAAAYYELDENLMPVETPMPEPLAQVGRTHRAENCEPALCTVLFIGGAGGSLRAGVTENPVA